MWCCRAVRLQKIKPLFELGRVVACAGYGEISHKIQAAEGMKP